MKTYIGVSDSCGFAEMLRLFELDFVHSEDGLAPLETLVGASYIDPGSFEIYDREDYREESFDRELIEELFPIKVGPSRNLWQEDLDAIRCVFFITNQKEWRSLSCDQLRVTDVLDEVEWID